MSSQWLDPTFRALTHLKVRAKDPLTDRPVYNVNKIKTKTLLESTLSNSLIRIFSHLSPYLIELKMAQQSWRAKSRTYTKFQPNRSNYIKDTANLIGFSTVRKWRYEVTQTWNCVSGVRPCLVHSQNLSNLTVHFDGGQNPYWTAVWSGYWQTFPGPPPSNFKSVRTMLVMTTFLPEDKKAQVVSQMW